MPLKIILPEDWEATNLFFWLLQRDGGLWPKTKAPGAIITNPVGQINQKV